MPEQLDKHIKKPRRSRMLGPVAHKFVAMQTGSWRLECPVTDYGKCIKCGICQRYCPLNVITIYRDRRECVEINLDYCKGCGICANVCPQGAISMVEEEAKLNG
jgi:pyruvate ferredoxin oxidoreductase delta subunit